MLKLVRMNAVLMDPKLSSKGKTRAKTDKALNIGAISDDFQRKEAVKVPKTEDARGNSSFQAYL